MAKVGQASCLSLFLKWRQAGSLSYERARTGLRVFLVNQSGENDFRFERARFYIRQFAQRGEHGGDGTFRVARAATVKFSIFALRNEFRSVRADGVQMRREQNSLFYFISRQKSRNEIETIRQDFLKFHFQSGARGDGGEKIRDALFTGVWVARRQKGRVHARQRDEFGQKFFRARHA